MSECGPCASTLTARISKGDERTLSSARWRWAGSSQRERRTILCERWVGEVCAIDVVILCRDCHSCADANGHTQDVSKLRQAVAGQQQQAGRCAYQRW